MRARIHSFLSLESLARELDPNELKRKASKTLEEPDLQANLEG